MSSTTLNATITGLRFFFEVTLRRHDALALMNPMREPRTLPVALNATDVEQIITAAGSLKFRAALLVCVIRRMSVRDSGIIRYAYMSDAGTRLPFNPSVNLRTTWATLSCSLIELAWINNDIRFKLEPTFC